LTHSLKGAWFQTLTLEHQSWFQNVPFKLNLRPPLHREWAPGYYLGRTTFGARPTDNRTFCHPQLNHLRNKRNRNTRGEAVHVQSG
jgi:hypothetical protein